MSNSKSPKMLLIGVGTMLGSMTIAGFLLGYLIDYWLDTQPLFLFSLGVFGFIGGMLKVKELITESDKPNDAAQ